MSEYRVEMTGIGKSFGGVNALKDVSFRVRPGRIHALVGENGAGKSTLMKILSGAYSKDAGWIKIDGKEVSIPNPHTGRKLGIAIIYQEFALAPDLTVAENIYLDHLGSKKGFINRSRLYRDADELINSIGFEINPRSTVGDLTVAYQQVVEITKALSEKAKILILDEPTSVLAPRETERLFEVLRRLKQQDVSIIYISHRLDEIFRIADVITVIKDGVVTGSVGPAEVSTDDVISMMIGRKLAAMFPKRDCAIGDELFCVENLTKGKEVRNFSFSVRAGQVLGIAGLVGAGRTETMRAIFGADPKDTGTITLDGRPLKINSPTDAVKAGIGFVPEDRKEQGTILSMSVRKNVTMPSLSERFSGFGFIKQAAEKKNTKKLIEKLAIKTSSTETDVADLSGGNQQKVVLAKWLGTDCRVIILDEPTRGVDVGAKVEIYNLINELAADGLAIIVISSEMTEIIGICDRVLVMRAGCVQGVLEKDELTEENIMNLAIVKQPAYAL
ncbi:MAG TPA: sugar ABC transporter ATP-binding protein [Planctomycetes bacterium]|nr:sugar ABC transporter ATP-binding protein [Planctomycetota bacterium]